MEVSSLEIGKLYVLSPMRGMLFATSVTGTVRPDADHQVARRSRPDSLGEIVEIEHGVPFVLLGVDNANLFSAKITMLYKNMVLYVWDNQNFMEKL